METPFEVIFDKTRIPSHLHAFPLFFYFPIGIVLAILRFFIGLHAFLTNLILKPFPVLKCFVLRIMCSILGFIVVQYHSDKKTEDDAKVFVANHITNFDHLAINVVKPCTVPSVWNLPTSLNWILGYTDFGVMQGRSVLIENVKKFIADTGSPILVFPEGATTNGEVGMLKFSVWPFSLDQPVQPIALRILQPPILRVSPSVLGSRWWSDMFWFLFMPYTIFILRYLPLMTKRNAETNEEFCARVQKQMCGEMNLQPTNVTSLDKVEYAKSFMNDKTQIEELVVSLNKKET